MPFYRVVVLSKISFVGGEGQRFIIISVEWAYNDPHCNSQIPRFKRDKKKGKKVKEKDRGSKKGCTSLS